MRFVNSVLEDVRADGTWADWYIKDLKPKNGKAPAPPPAKYGRPS